MKNLTVTKLIVWLIAISMTNFAAADCLKDKLQTWATADHRGEGHAERNDSRNPVETLKFFGIEPTMTVVEISPGGSGWYTEILAPFLRESGTLYLGGFDPDSEVEYYQRNSKKFADKLAANPEVYDKAILTVFDPAGKMEAAPVGSADMVVTFRNIHNWKRGDNAQKAFDAMFTYLRPGGLLGLVQHRGVEGEEYTGEKGYLTESQVIAMAEKAGFVLLDTSEVNANPKDTKDHQYGVWSLPPAYRSDDEDVAKKAAMTAIGESDRMTLKFMRPVKAPSRK